MQCARAGKGLWEQSKKNIAYNYMSITIGWVLYFVNRNECVIFNTWFCVAREGEGKWNSVILMVYIRRSCYLPRVVLWFCWRLRRKSSENQPTNHCARLPYFFPFSCIYLEKLYILRPKKMGNLLKKRKKSGRRDCRVKVGKRYVLFTVEFLTIFFLL